MSVEEQRKSIAEVSESNLDDWVRMKSFTHEVEEVSYYNSSVYLYSTISESADLPVYI